MLLKDILNESVDFSVIFLKKGSNGDYWSPKEHKVTKECEACDGTGKEEHAGQVYPCPYCDGSGKYETWEDEHPTINVANANARMIIQDIFGMGNYGNDLVGSIPKEQLPEIKRRLLKLKNTSIDHLTKDQETIGGKTVVGKSGDTPRITKTATIHDMGRSSDQVKRYVDNLIKIIDTAQKEGGTVGWS